MAVNVLFISWSRGITIYNVASPECRGRGHSTLPFPIAHSGHPATQVAPGTRFSMYHVSTHLQSHCLEALPGGIAKDVLSVVKSAHHVTPT